MAFQRLRETWEAFGEHAPLWAIESAARSGGWDLDRFFASGQKNVDDVLTSLAERGLRVGGGRALDFGCGVGRLTRALSAHFDECDAVDVAASMIGRARELNDGIDRLRFHHNAAANLRCFPDDSFDFILSLFVLQHIEPAVVREYLREFVRVLRPGGAAVFNIPECVVPARELPDEAFQASLASNRTAFEAAPRQPLTMMVEVRNASPVLWPADSQLQLGNHWRHASGEMLRFDDERVVIEAALEPGAGHWLRLDVFVPSQPGSYVLELDLVQDGVAWFADHGSPTLRLAVSVGGPHHDSSGSADEEERVPKMEMHTMAREEVVAAVERAGGVVLETIRRDRCGPLTLSLDYVVARPLGTALPSPAQRTRSGADHLGDAIEAWIRDPVDVAGKADRPRSAQWIRPRHRPPWPASDGRRAESRSLPRRLLDAWAYLSDPTLSGPMSRLRRALQLVDGLGVSRGDLRRRVRRRDGARDASRDMAHLLSVAGQRITQLERARDDAARELEELQRRLTRAEVGLAAMSRAPAQQSGPAPPDTD